MRGEGLPRRIRCFRPAAAALGSRLCFFELGDELLHLLAVGGLRGARPCAVTAALGAPL